MIQKRVKLNDMKDIDTFNKICSKFSCDVDLQAGKYYVDAKSIMGIFSLDLEKPLTLLVDTDEETTVTEAFKAFLIDESITNS